MKRRGWIVAAAALVLAGYVGGSIVYSSVEQEAASTTAETFAGNLDALCQADEQRARSVGTDCSRAAAVAREGIGGRKGDPGRGIVGTTLSAGRLVVTYSDGTSADVGNVTGAPGEPGAAGRGIAGTTIEAGRLVVTFTDGGRADLGAIVGPAGRGIASTAAVNGRLVVTYTDGTSQDAGPLPAGPKGDEGDPGEDGQPAPSVRAQVFVFPDGSSRSCTRTGGADDAPEFRCGDLIAPPQDPPPLIDIGPEGGNG